MSGKNSGFENRASVTVNASGAGRKVKLDDLEQLEFETSENVQVLPTFDRMKLKEELLRGIYGK